MYDFDDKGGRRIALRPEGTASVVRAFVQHRPATPWKVWYAAPSFRYERPQAGRYRQHHQLGLEALGSADPDLDVEVIALAWDYLRSLGLQQVRAARELHRHARRPCRLRRRCSATGSPTASTSSTPATATRSPTTPCASSTPSVRPPRRVAAEAPHITDHLSPEGNAALRPGAAPGSRRWASRSASSPAWCAGSTTTRTPPSSSRPTRSTRRRARSLGGGRYDGLVEALGGPATPGIGFGSGIERVLLACDAEGVFPAPAVARRVRRRHHRGSAGPRPHQRAAPRRLPRRPRLRPALHAGPDEGGRPLGRRGSP